MSLINWGAVTPPNDQGPAREVASITGLLSALADRRMRAEQQAQQQEMLERDYQARQANTQVDNARLAEDQRMRGDHERRALENVDREYTAHEANTLADNTRQDTQNKWQRQHGDAEIAALTTNQRAIRAEMDRTHTTSAFEKALELQKAGYDEQAQALLDQDAAARRGGPGPVAPRQAPVRPPPGPPPVAAQPQPLAPASPGVFPGAEPPPAEPPPVPSRPLPGAPGSPGFMGPMAPPPPAPPAPAQGMGPGASIPMVGGSTPPGGAMPPPPAPPPMAAPPPRMPVSSHVLPPIDRAAVGQRNLATIAPYEAMAQGKGPAYTDALQELKANLAGGAMPPAKAQELFSRRVQFAQSQEGLNARATTRAEGDGAKKDLDLQRKGLDIEKQYQGAVQSMLALKKYGEVVHNDRKLAELARNAMGGVDNPALAAMVKGAFVKYAQGGTGVVSDQDMKVFWDRMGGLGVRTLQALEDVMSGGLVTEKAKMVQAAIDEMAASSRANYDDMGKSVVNTLHNMPDGDSRIPRFLKTYAPSYHKTWLANRAKNGPEGDDGAFLNDAVPE